MELKTKAGLIKGKIKGSAETFEILVTEKNCLKVKKKLELEINKALDILKDLKNQGKIKSISIPRNEEFQADIDKIVDFKETLKKSVEKIKEIF